MKSLKFQVRPVEGVKVQVVDKQPERLILDGQQRLTSITQAVATLEPVHTRNTKGKAIKRHFYFDIKMALQGEEYIEKSVITVDENRQRRTNFGRDIELDLSTRQLECEQLYFPCDQILNSDAWENALIKHAPDSMQLYFQFRQTIITAFRKYHLPIIELKKDISKEAVCLVFEKVNTGGVSLSVFELLTASYAAEGFNLRDDWLGSNLRGITSRKERIANDQLLIDVGSSEFLQAITLHYTQARKLQDIADGRIGKQIRPININRSAILDLPLSAYRQWADKVEKGFKEVALFLRDQCFFNAKDIPYSTQLVPLAAIMSLLGDRWREPKIQQKLAQWYWCGVLGELYGGAVETRIANDFEELQHWFNDDSALPRTVVEAHFDPNRLDYLKSRLSAAYKGINTLVLREGARDFFWKGTVQELDLQDKPLDIHHIFPKACCEKQGIARQKYDCIMNKTSISATANRKIGGSAPSAYLQMIQSDKQVQMDDDQMNAILHTHQIHANHLRNNEFELFLQSRKTKLVDLIYSAMGKQYHDETHVLDVEEALSEDSR